MKTLWKRFFTAGQLINSADYTIYSDRPARYIRIENQENSKSIIELKTK